MTSPLPTQTQIAFKLPVIDLWAVRGALDLREDLVLQLIEDGSLPWAWDIAVSGATRRCVRVLARCVSDYQSVNLPQWEGKNVRSILASYGSAAANAQEEEVVFQELFPNLSTFSGAPTILLDQVARRLNASPEHVRNLVKSSDLKLAPGTVSVAGPGGSPHILRSSVIKFMRARRML